MKRDGGVAEKMQHERGDEVVSSYGRALVIEVKRSECRKSHTASFMSSLCPWPRSIHRSPPPNLMSSQSSQHYRPKLIVYCSCGSLSSQREKMSR